MWGAGDRGHAVKKKPDVPFAEETETCCYCVLEALGFRQLRGVQEEGIKKEEELEEGQG